MEEYTIKKVIISQICDLFVKLTLFSLFLILVKDYDTFIISLFFIILYILYELYYILKSIKISRYFKKNKIDFTQEIVWCNKKDSFLLQDRFLICRFKVIDFKYSEIESIQVIQKKWSRSRSSPHVYYIINIELLNGKKYKIYMYAEDATESYRGIDNITDILLEKNKNIVVKK